MKLTLIILICSVMAAHDANAVWSDTVDYRFTPDPSPPPICIDRRIHAIRTRFRQEAIPRVESIRFTVREVRRGSEDIRRWIWFPKQDSVFFLGKDGKGSNQQVGYNRKTKWSLGSEVISRIDTMFLRDQFDLLFPQLFEAAGDVDIQLDGNCALPEGKPGKEADWMRISFPPDHGILSGETYEVLADTSGVIRAWKITGRGPENAGKRYDWSPPKEVDGLPLSLERIGPDGFAIRFTDVKVAGIVP